MKADTQARLFFWGTILLLLGALAAWPISEAVSRWRTRPTLDDANPAVRVAVIRALDRDSGDVDLLIRALRDEDADVRLVAAMHLKGCRAKAAPSARALLITSVKDNHVGVRREAAEALHAIGSAAAPTLLEALGDSNPRVRAKAAGALRVVAFMKTDALVSAEERRPSAEELASAAAALEKALQDEDTEVRENAADSLTYIRRAAAGERFYEGK